MSPNKLIRNELSNYADVKREILRLDFVAQGLHKACRQIEAESEKENGLLKQELVGLEEEDRALDTLVLTEEKRALDAVQAAQGLHKEKSDWEARVAHISSDIEQMQKEIVRMTETVDNAAQYRAFLQKLACNDPTKLEELLLNPQVLISEAQNKEKDVFSCAMLIQQLSHIEDRYVTHDLTTKPSICTTKKSKAKPKTKPTFNPLPPYEFGEPAFALVRQIFRTIPEDFNASRCTEILDMFAVLERFIFSLLDEIEEHEPPDVERIIRRVVVIKRKRAQAEKQLLMTRKREEREARALARALSPVKRQNKTKLIAYEPNVIVVKPPKERTFLPEETSQEDLSFMFEENS